MTSPLLYNETDRQSAQATRRKRRVLTLVPATLLLLGAVALFVAFRIRHDETGWVWSALITVAGGAYALFFYETYLRPASQYLRHINYMLGNRLRETQGVLAYVDQTPQTKDDLDFIPITINIGETADPKDDRLFYIDALKGLPPFAIGERITVFSNDGRVAGMERAREET